MMNMDPRFKSPLQHVCVKNSFRIALQMICHSCSHKSADFDFDCDIHCSVMASGSDKLKNFERYLSIISRPSFGSLYHSWRKQESNIWWKSLNLVSPLDLFKTWTFVINVLKRQVWLFFTQNVDLGPLLTSKKSTFASLWAMKSNVVPFLSQKVDIGHHLTPKIRVWI